MLATAIFPARSFLRAPQVTAVKALPRYFTSSAPKSRQRLVILGSGWGGYEVLRGVDKKRWSEPGFLPTVSSRYSNIGRVDVTMLSASGYFNFTPLLAGCAVGTLEFRCAVEPVRT
jgi:NADH dehydrogenase FAD-containing subunit